MPIKKFVYAIKDLEKNAVKKCVLYAIPLPSIQWEYEDILFKGEAIFYKKGITDHPFFRFFMEKQLHKLPDTNNHWKKVFKAFDFKISEGKLYIDYHFKVFNFDAPYRYKVIFRNLIYDLISSLVYRVNEQDLLDSI